jgi:hypothetical protein
MGAYDTTGFGQSLAGRLLHRLQSIPPAGAPPSELNLDLRDTNALHELERLGYVRLERGTGAMSWRIERVRLTEAGRAKLAEQGG